MLYICLTFICAIIFCFVMYSCKKLNKDRLGKILAIIYCILVFISIFFPDGLIRSYDELDKLLTDINRFHLYVRLLYSIVIIVIPISVFYDNKIFKVILVYYCLPVTILSILSYNQYIHYFTDLNGRGINNITNIPQEIKDFMLNTTFRSIYQMMIWIIALTIELKVLIFDKFYNIKKLNLCWKDLLLIFFLIILLIFQMVPIYLPQLLANGYGSIALKSYNYVHLLWILYIVLKIVIINKIFKNKPYEIKHMVCVILAIAVLFQYNQLFSLTISIKRLPFQLCNLASYLMLIALISKSKKLFNFNFLINVLGASLALLVPDMTNNNILNVWNLHYIYEHTNVLVVPILCLTFDLFGKIDKKSYKNAVLGFIIYFGFCIIMGTVFNSLAIKLNNDAYELNYLFMFDKEKIADFLPILSFLTNFEIKVFYTNLYPFLLLFVLCGYLGLVTLFYLPFRFYYKHKNKLVKD